MTYRCDRLAWARAILSDKHWWCYRGITKPETSTIRWHNNKRVPSTPKNKAAATICDDTSYMEYLAGQEVKYQVEDDVYGDEWEEHVRDATHRDGCCPNSKDPQERKEYKERFKKRLDDADAKHQWLWDRLDWDVLRDWTVQECERWEFFQEFLGKHPVYGLITTYDEHRFIELEDVVGFCPKCDNPGTKEDLSYSNGGDSLYDHLWMFCCPACREKFVVDECEEDRFIEEHGHPFNWPPGAPYPPRRGFLGEPMEAPPWEP